MPLWEVDFSDIDSDTEVPDDIDGDEDLPQGYNEEFEKVDNFLHDNLVRAKESNDVDMINFVVEQGILRYTRLGLKKEVLDKQIWITKQLGKGILKNMQHRSKSAELKTQITYVQEMIVDQKKKEVELKNRVASLRAERDFKKARLEAVLRGNQGSMNEISHINKRRALIQERLRLDTIEYEQEKALREDLRQSFIGYSEDLDRQLENAPWLVEKQKKAARRKELEDEIESLQSDLAKIELIEERNRIAEQSERDLPFKQFCVQLAELYLKREKLFKQLSEEKMNVKKLEEEKRSRRYMEESSQMDCTQAILDGDLDDEETLMKMAKHYKIDTQNLNVPVSQMTQMTQESQPICRKRAQSPAESTASSEANDSMSESGEPAAALAPPPTKKVSIVEPIHNPDESVDERTTQPDANNEINLDESCMEEDDQNGDKSQPEQLETDEREEDDEGREGEEEYREEEEEQVEQHEQEESPNSQESHATVASQESVIAYAPDEMVEEEADNNDGFRRPSDPTKVDFEANEDNLEAETSFNPEMILDISANSNDPGGDFFDMMNNQATHKRAVADATGSSPTAGAGDNDFMSMFGGGGGGDAGAVVDDATSFSFNFGGADANDTNGGGGGGGGEFNFFGF